MIEPEKKKKRNSLLDTEMFSGDGVFAENKLIKAVLAVLCFIALVLHYDIAELKESYRAVIHFPGTNETAEITGNKASERYVLLAAEFFASNYFSATPATVDQQYSGIMYFVHPTRYGEMQERFDKEAERLKKLKTATIYGNVIWSRGFQQIEYTGDKYKALRGEQIYTVRFDVGRSIYVGSSASEPSSTERKTMAIDYVIENGRFWLLDMILEEQRASL